MTAQEKFQQSVKEALALHGQNQWGNQHSFHVITEMLAEECGVDGKTLRESDAGKLALKVVNPSAFAQWMENHVKGFKRPTRGERSAKLIEDFAV